MAFLPLLLGLASSGVAMTSPWWENYDTRDRYLCTDKAGVVLERNASQASLISGGSRMTLFRESTDGPALIYRNDDLRVILRGDELTVERLPMTIVCLRSQEV